MRRLLLVLPIGVVTLAGCVQREGDGRYPSLLPRAVETQPLTVPEDPATEVAGDSSVDAQVSAIEARLDAAERAFNTAARSAEATIARARGTAEGSEPWLDAQTALAELDRLREPVTTAISDLDAIAIGRGAQGLAPYPAVQQASDRAAALAAAQQARSQSLEDALPGT
jgi:hypothetical protein